jgi:hypothetical protein
MHVFGMSRFQSRKEAGLKSILSGSFRAFFWENVGTVAYLQTENFLQHHFDFIVHNHSPFRCYITYASEEASLNKRNPIRRHEMGMSGQTVAPADLTLVEISVGVYWKGKYWTGHSQSRVGGDFLLTN